MRDALYIPISKDEKLVITTDNSGAIGMKEQDAVKVPYKTVSYHSFRVAIMECLATGATPISIVIQNFCGEEAWDEIVTGVKKGLLELQMENVPITGSTESNFPLSQSAMGLSVIGKKSNVSNMEQQDIQQQHIALIGLPLVGEEVISQADKIAPLSIFKEICSIQDVTVWPVGSKGVLHELERMIPGLEKNGTTSSSKVDLIKSGGPSTSFLVAYPFKSEQRIKEIAGKHFYKL
ncbi:AIR synthase related protein [Oceanobacillus bengalensis]|uniref:ATP-binding protein n=1 Tax=Oceanobacillus bengalensis TaxID=1435466 RepID=A0A494YTK6_9BACI|nr:AIR synthase related protein [Oceanobacillus bengalensis]RKQ13430.1 ATP-binding protein [Oceanobacillus bengalensis]